MKITKSPGAMSDPSMRKLLQDQAMREFYRPIRAKRQLAPGEKEILRDIALETIGDQQITYLEFGVFEGNSMRSMISRFTHVESRFFGFDSFEGLPEAWDPLPKVNHKQGSFNRKGNLPPIDDVRVEFVKGWFQNTLPSFLSTGCSGGPWPHLVHYDADLYSATLFVLSSLWHHLPSYYFMMDEFMYDEIVALRDFAHSYPVEVQFIAECGDKLFGHVRRVPFTL